MELPTPNGLVTLTTDFGLQDPYVGVMHGVLKARSLRADVVDLTHGVPAHDVRTGALFLRAAAGRFPTGTIHVGVVDPGVGTSRRALAVCAGGAYWIGPDNGLLTPALGTPGGCEVRALDLDALRLPAPSRTFWGRDVFAPVAGMLAGRRWGFRALGPRVDDPEVFDDLTVDQPRVLVVDRFGNLITGLSAEAVRASGAVAVRVGERRVPLVETYGGAAPGEVLALINSYDLLEVAIREGRAADELGVGVGAAVELEAGAEP